MPTARLFSIRIFFGVVLRRISPPDSVTAATRALARLADPPLHIWALPLLARRAAM